MVFWSGTCPAAHETDALQLLTHRLLDLADQQETSGLRGAGFTRVAVGSCPALEQPTEITSLSNYFLEHGLEISFRGGLEWLGSVGAHRCPPSTNSVPLVRFAASRLNELRTNISRAALWGESLWVSAEVHSVGEPLRAQLLDHLTNPLVLAVQQLAGTEARLESVEPLRGAADAADGSAAGAAAGSAAAGSAADAAGGSSNSSAASAVALRAWGRPLGAGRAEEVALLFENPGARAAKARVPWGARVLSQFSPAGAWVRAVWATAAWQRNADVVLRRVADRHAAAASLDGASGGASISRALPAAALHTFEVPPRDVVLLVVFSSQRAAAAFPPRWAVRAPSVSLGAPRQYVRDFRDHAPPEPLPPRADDGSVPPPVQATGLPAPAPEAARRRGERDFDLPFAPLAAALAASSAAAALLLRLAGCRCAERGAARSAGAMAWPQAWPSPTAAALSEEARMERASLIESRVETPLAPSYHAERADLEAYFAEPSLAPAERTRPGARARRDAATAPPRPPPRPPRPPPRPPRLPPPPLPPPQRARLSPRPRAAGTESKRKRARPSLPAGWGGPAPGRDEQAIPSIPRSREPSTALGAANDVAARRGFAYSSSCQRLTEHSSDGGGPNHPGCTSV